MGVSIPFIAGQWSLPPRATHLPPLTRGLNPLHCGAVVASRGCVRRRRRLRDWSQSPSLRGSGRFAQSRKRRRGKPPSLNPLHCGAVVASPRLGWIGLDLTPPCLNPLHCGAVVASNFGVYRSKWGAESQSPSLRGSGRFGPHEAPRRHRLLRLNPLHCGAVVASRRLGPRFGRRSKVSIPFIAGQWSLLR